MSKKKKKCGCSNHVHVPVQPGSLPGGLRIIPVREIPDNCVLICNGPFCTLACFGSDLRVIHCDIICDEAGNCTVNCTPDEAE